MSFLLLCRLFAARCKGCEEVIGPAELVMLAGKVVYHLACFRCCACGVNLQRGDQCVLREGRLLCVADYHHQRPTSPESSLSGRQKHTHTYIYKHKHIH